MSKSMDKRKRSQKGLPILDDHGTKVQCPKCNEWVSGNHKCPLTRKSGKKNLSDFDDTWSMECGECGGEGNYDDAPDGSCSEHFVECPACHGKRIELEVAVPAEHEGGTGYYRSLTVEEVEDMAHRVTDEIMPTLKEGITYIVNLAKEGKLIQSHTGAPVRLKGG